LDQTAKIVQGLLTINIQGATPLIDFARAKIVLALAMAAIPRLRMNGREREASSDQLAVAAEAV
jgi:hypothetical protein